ncbi:hypothetical protein SASPL_102792 [Salvia splendens]|uniref:Uncharacterized protein n=1 Tax=Salvia splendens TaxID=180675 RepID=A0A8X9AD57_SALSN|nr:hypothetical protein SASPL_102792 [Salvia splendens]
MSKRRMSFDKEEASNSREIKLPRRNPNHQEAPIRENPNQEEGEADPNQEEGEAPIEEEGDADPNPEEEGQIPAQDLLFEKTLTFREGTCSQLIITGAHRGTLMAFLTDAEREKAERNGGCLKVPTRDANGNGVGYELELKRNSMTYFNGWGRVQTMSTLGIQFRALGKFRLNLNIIRNPNPIPANPNPEEQDLLFKKKLSYTETKRDQLLIGQVLAFLTDEEREKAENIDVGLMVPTRVEYELELKRNKEIKKRMFHRMEGGSQVNSGEYMFVVCFSISLLSH